MPKVGDKVSVHSKAGPRVGIVTASSGSMLQVHWETGGESSIIPGPGTLTVVGRARGKRLATAAPTTKRTARPSATTLAKKPKASSKPTSTSSRAKGGPRPKPADKQTGASKRSSSPASARATVKRKKASPAKKAEKRAR